MKLKILLIALFLTFFVGATEKSYGGVSFGVFYSSLSGSGEWIDCNLGYVWRPAHVNPGWRPYLYGRWVWTDDYGWYWVSAEPFGWATYHYGRWYYDDYYGWVWVPDEVWGPAWVEWRYDDDYVGWAPLAPYAAFSFDVGVTYRHPWVAPYHYWSFVSYHNFTADRMADCVQPAERNARLFGSTRAVLDIRSTDNRIVNRGVDLNVIERRGNIRIRTADVVDRPTADREQLVRDGGRERIEAYRPKLEARMRDQVTRPRDATVSNRRIATDFEQTPREKHQDRIRSIEREPSPMAVPRRDRPAPPVTRVPVPENRRPVERPVPGDRVAPGRVPDRTPTPPEKGWRMQRPGRNPQMVNPGGREMRPPAIKRENAPRQPQRVPPPRERGNDNGGRQKRDGGGRG